ncbi:hypothetical protein GUJ93_ZPchr0006g45800 [Zizania palustris]|uniref:Uncharacterized protein n=1 Tax=Zizania palustris TaxID=103762 RepID=A0A8J5SXS7_ZIZPA|nr:hypothetical protein GUJ93_ZPchr0006g45800 [Zizania palustris]
MPRGSRWLNRKPRSQRMSGEPRQQSPEPRHLWGLSGGPIDGFFTRDEGSRAKGKNSYRGVTSEAEVEKLQFERSALVAKVDRLKAKKAIFETRVFELTTSATRLRTSVEGLRVE